MTTLMRNRSTLPLILKARTAADLMTTNPQSLRRDATVAEAAAFLTTRGYSAAPVVDEAGRPVGVVSRTDLLRHYGRTAVHLLAAPPGRSGVGAEPDGSTPVEDVMTPGVYCVHADTPAARVVNKMLLQNVRRLFVLDDAGVLVGVVSAFDVLRGLDRPFRVAG